MSRFWVNNAGKLIVITDDTQDRSSDGLIEVPSNTPSENHIWGNGEWVYIEPDVVISIPSVTLWERMTEQEGEQVEAAMLLQSFRTRQIFTTAQTYRSDHELWPLLQRVAIGLFGDERAEQLLAP